MMRLLSSKTLIQAHALFLFVLAIYLTKSPEVVTDSDVVFMLGEVLQIDRAPNLSRPSSPFALCGIVLLVQALFDLIVVSKVPQIGEILAMAEAARSTSPISIAGAMRTNPFIARLASLYSEIWTLLAAWRFCLFFAISFFIYQSKSSAWGLDGVGPTSGYGFPTEPTSGLDQLKNRVIFTYGFMEMMFWLWIYLTLREERQEAAAHFVDE